MSSYQNNKDDKSDNDMYMHVYYYLPIIPTMLRLMMSIASGRSHGRIDGWGNDGGRDAFDAARRDGIFLSARRVPLSGPQFPGSRLLLPEL